MKFSCSFSSTLVGIALFMTSQLVQAKLTCSAAESAIPANFTMALQGGVISVPRDMLVGARIFVQRFNPAAAGISYECKTTESRPDANSRFKVEIEGNPLAFFGEPSQYVGKVYPTNIPGIGVAWHGGQGGVNGVGKAEEFAPPILPGCTAFKEFKLESGSCRTARLGFLAPSISLLKTGPVAAGTIDSSKLGALVMSVTVGDSDLLPVARLKLSGSINIVSGTCKTSSVNVDMGKQNISTLIGIGSATPQVNFTIALTDCPAFAGFYPDSGVAAPISSEQELNNGIISKGIRKDNTLTVRVDPVATPIDAANGVLSIETGAGMATGIGVQLRGPAGEPLALSQSLAVTGTLAKSINITLGARYLQTTKTVTPGKANAVATYTIIYQ